MNQAPLQYKNIAAVASPARQIDLATLLMLVVVYARNCYNSRENMMRWGMKLRSLSWSGLVLMAALLLSPLARATVIQVTYGNAGIQSADSAALCAGTTVCVLGTENFDSRTTANLTGGFTSTFGLSGAQTITGTYSADATAKSGSNLVSQPANQYGGAGGTGNYAELFNGSYTINLSATGVPGVNYFGIWVSALDANNQIQFYNGSTLIYTFTPTAMLAAINARANKSAYYGNPTTNYLGQDSGEPFAFVNFFGVGGTFDKLVISNSGGTGFESDNHTVGYRNPNTIIGNLFGVPEPGAMLLLPGFLLALWRARRQFQPR